MINKKHESEPIFIEVVTLLQFFLFIDYRSIGFVTTVCRAMLRTRPAAGHWTSKSRPSLREAAAPRGSPPRIIDPPPPPSPLGAPQGRPLGVAATAATTATTTRGYYTQREATRTSRPWRAARCVLRRFFAYYEKNAPNYNFARFLIIPSR